jgi:hypothetical protein
MPQGKRTAEEEAEFSRMLPQINVLYLGMQCLLVLDISYASRFWCVRARAGPTRRALAGSPPRPLILTHPCSRGIFFSSFSLSLSLSAFRCASGRRRTQFEFWLAMQVASVEGLNGTAGGGARRWLARCIHNAPEMYVQMLEKMWSDKAPDEARAILSKPDVTVTSQKDKDVQLPKLADLNAQCVEAWATLNAWREEQRERERTQRAARTQLAKAFKASVRLARVDAAALAEAIEGAAAAGMLDEELRAARERLRQVRAVDALIVQTAELWNGLRVGDDDAAQHAAEVRAALAKLQERF